MTKYYKKLDSEYYIKSIPLTTFLYQETQIDLEKFNYTHNYGQIGFLQATTIAVEDSPIDLDDYEEITLEEWNKAVDNLCKSLKT